MKSSLEPKKLALLRILQILEQYSDCDNPFKQEDIADYLDKDNARIEQSGERLRVSVKVSPMAMEYWAMKRKLYFSKFTGTGNHSPK